MKAWEVFLVNGIKIGVFASSSIEGRDQLSKIYPNDKIEFIGTSYANVGLDIGPDMDTTLDEILEEINCIYCELFHRGDDIYLLDSDDAHNRFDFKRVKYIKYCPMCGKMLNTRKEK